MRDHGSGIVVDVDESEVGGVDYWALPCRLIDGGCQKQEVEKERKEQRDQVYMVTVRVVVGLPQSRLKRRALSRPQLRFAKVEAVHPTRARDKDFALDTQSNRHHLNISTAPKSVRLDLLDVTKDG